jgi:hypothetical protein
MSAMGIMGVSLTLLTLAYSKVIALMLEVNHFQYHQDPPNQ